MAGSFSLLILPIIILLSPVVVKIAAKQEKSAKQKLHIVFQISLIIIVSLSLFNWETQTPGGRNALQLAADLKNVFLWLFLLTTVVQIILLHLKIFPLAAVLNFANTLIFFAAVITISNTLGKQIVSPSIITAAMIVLANNITSLALANKDPNLQTKYPWGNSKKTKAQK